MIITQNQYNVEPDIEVVIYDKSPSRSPFIVRVADGTSIHMSHKDASSLHLQLTAALYEYEEKQS